MVIAGPDLLDEVSRLKQAKGGDLLSWGTGQLTDALAAAGLLDEYRILHLPRHQGRRRAPVSPRQHRHRRGEFLDTKIVATGAVIHAYRPTSAP